MDVRRLVGRWMEKYSDSSKKPKAQVSATLDTHVRALTLCGYLYRAHSSPSPVSCMSLAFRRLKGDNIVVLMSVCRLLPPSFSFSIIYSIHFNRRLRISLVAILSSWHSLLVHTV